MPPRTATPSDEPPASLGELTLAQRQTFGQLRAALQAPAGTRNLNWYLSFGRGVLNLRGAEQRSRRYGWMKLLAAALQCSTSLLHKTRYFARNYTDQDARQLADEKITWAMAYPTFSVKGKRPQMARMRQAKIKGWTVPQLVKVVQRARGGPRHGGGPRRLAPTSYGHAIDLRDLVRTNERWLCNYREVWSAGEGLLDQLAALPEEEYSAELVGRLEEAERLLEELAEAASALKQSLVQARETGGRRGRTRRRIGQR